MPPGKTSEMVRLPRVIGHRGAAAVAPENTLAGLRAAAECGVSWVEVDVRLTADDGLVLIHDDTLDRTTDGSGPVRAASLAGVRALDAGAWFSSAFAGEKVPTLEEAIALLATLDLRVNLEMKADAGDEAATGAALAGALRASWPADREPPLISSFRYDCIAAFAAAMPELPLAFLMNWSHKDWGTRRTLLDWRAIHCSQHRLTRQRVAVLKQSGLPVAAYTVNTARRAKTLFGYGVDAVFSDDPGALLAAL